MKINRNLCDKCYTYSKNWTNQLVEEWRSPVQSLLTRADNLNTILETMSPKEISLRPAKETDTWTLSAIHIAAIKALPTTFYTRKELLAWRNYLDKPDACSILRHLKLETIRVAIEDEMITGFASFAFNELISLYVHPHYQGQGIGRTLVENFCYEASEQGFDSVITTASLYAEGFYLRLGFIPIQRVPHHLGGRLVVPVTEMTKDF